MLHLSRDLACHDVRQDAFSRTLLIAFFLQRLQMIFNIVGFLAFLTFCILFITFLHLWLVIYRFRVELDIFRVRARQTCIFI